MAVGLSLLSVARSFVHRKLPFLHAVSWLKRQGISYVYREFGDAFSKEWDRQEKASSLGELGWDAIPGPAQISERPMKQFTRYSVYGEVSIWNRATGEVQKINQHVYTNRVMTVAEYNELLIESYRLSEEWMEKYGIGMGSLVLNAKVLGIEHNEGWSW